LIRYSDDLTGGHAIEVHEMDDGRIRVRVTNRPQLAKQEWFGDAADQTTQEALTEIARMEEAGEL
jgi:hypothetical protein